MIPLFPTIYRTLSAKWLSQKGISTICQSLIVDSPLGQPFAWQESLLTIALILKHFYLELVDPSYNLRIKQTLTIKPEGFEISVRSRQQVEILSEKNETKNRRPMSIPFGP